VFLRDSESIEVLDDLLAIMYYWDKPTDEEERVMHNMAVVIMEIMGLHQPATRLHTIIAMKNKALEIQAMEPMEEK
jgi:hypothetical protein